MNAFVRAHRRFSFAPILIAAAITLTSITGCTAPESPREPANSALTEAAFPRTLTDDAGQEVLVPAAPASIVALTPASVETLVALGLADRVVAIAECTCTPAELADTPTVASYTGVDVEAIVALQPDLVFVAAPPFTPVDAITAMRAANLTLVTLNPTSVSGVLGTIQLIGDATGSTLLAADLTAEIESEITALVSLVDQASSVSVFYEIDATSAIYGLAPDDYAAELVALAGGALVSSGTPGVYEISLEQLIAAAPEVILLGDAAYGVTAEVVAARPGWSSIPAVANGDVRPIDGDLVTTPGPRLAEALAALIRAINPTIVLP